MKTVLHRWVSLTPYLPTCINSSPSLPQVWFLLHGGGACPCRPLQRHPHHLPAQTGGTLLPGLLQHLGPQGLPAPVNKKKRIMGFLWCRGLKKTQRMFHSLPQTPSPRTDMVKYWVIGEESSRRTSVRMKPIGSPCVFEQNTTHVHLFAIKGA